jgi:hypothetical protein
LFTLQDARGDDNDDMDDEEANKHKWAGWGSGKGEVLSGKRKRTGPAKVLDTSAEETKHQGMASSKARTTNVARDLTDAKIASESAKRNVKACARDLVLAKTRVKEAKVAATEATESSTSIAAVAADATADVVVATTAAEQNSNGDESEDDDDADDGGNYFDIDTVSARKAHMIKRVLGYAKHCVRPAYEYYIDRFDPVHGAFETGTGSGVMIDGVILMDQYMSFLEAARYFNPQLMTEESPTGPALKQLLTPLVMLKGVTEEIIDACVKSAPQYLAAAKGVVMPANWVGSSFTGGIVPGFETLQTPRRVPKRVKERNDAADAAAIAVAAAAAAAAITAAIKAAAATAAANVAAAGANVDADAATAAADAATDDATQAAVDAAAAAIDAGDEDGDEMDTRERSHRERFGHGGPNCLKEEDFIETWWREKDKKVSVQASCHAFGAYCRGLDFERLLVASVQPDGHEEEPRLGYADARCARYPHVGHHELCDRRATVEHVQRDLHGRSGGIEHYSPQHSHEVEI